MGRRCRMGLSMVRLVCVAGLSASSVAAGAQVAAAPRPDSTARALRLFFDCAVKAGCDFDYLRTEIPWVDYVRDRTAAQVHVIATSLDTGSGGLEVTLKLIGLGDLTGTDDEVKYATPQGATADEQRGELVRVLKIGLGRYLLHVGLSQDFVLSHVPRGPVSAIEHGADPWDFWVFNVSAYGSANGQTQSSYRELSASVSASRTTEQWRLRASATATTDHYTYLLSDSSTYEANTHSYSASALLARSLGNHFALGLSSSAVSSTSQNIDLRARVAPTLEYDVFRYDQYTRRRLVASYSVGYNRFRYADTTIYDKLNEALVDETYSLWYATTQPWGNIYVGAIGSNYLHDFQQNRLTAYGGVTFRIVRGLQFSANGSYARIHDQVNLARGGASNEEILLQIRQLRTSYTYSGYVSLGYTFGSLFNNVVNPRLEGGGAGPP